MKNKPMKLLAVVISDDSHPIYAVHRDLMRQVSHPDVRIVFVHSSPNVTESTLDGDILTVPGEEGWNRLIHKTMAALEFLKDEPYDYLVRGNLSSYFRWDRLIQFLETCPRTGCYAGKPIHAYGVNYATGCGFYMSRDVVHTLLDLREEVLAVGIMDDVDIGTVLGRRGYAVTPADFLHAWDIEREIPDDAYHFRLKRQSEGDRVDESILRKKLMIHDSAKATVFGLEHQYAAQCRTFSDIWEHLPTLRSYASRCTQIVECGVRDVTSSYAFACALRGKEGGNLTLVDPYHSPRVDSFLEECRREGVSATFFGESDLTCPLIPTDLLFIDTWHVYAQLKRELARWHGVVRQYILLHDTTVDAWYGESIRNGWDPAAQSREYGFPEEEIRRGLWPAVLEFLVEHPEWILERRDTNNNGLTVLRRITTA